MNNSVITKHTNGTDLPQTNISTLSTNNSPTLNHFHHLLIITGALFLCIFCLYTLIYCVETKDTKRRQNTTHRIIPTNN